MKTFSKLVKIAINRTNQRFQGTNNFDWKSAYYHAVIADFKYYFNL